MALGRNMMSICNGLKIKYRNESRYVGMLSCCRHQPCALCCGDDPLLLTMTECSDTYQTEAHKLTSASQPPQLSHPLLDDCNASEGGLSALYRRKRNGRDRRTSAGKIATPRGHTRRARPAMSIDGPPTTIIARHPLSRCHDEEPDKQRV
ncbi:hypothetical protein BS50DRAFT_151970 [Corynespora cassiicola Philippines]|uniref:Uncharacterized protein n=1 Tax=Corynespora cassiicola Philippines TaxID=1448308 RepID=A0A2T2N7R4_CORCC|nr:hypothetical protein BS50DRAFT_151970 [Corynespora cassiicola Philippines]